jgi:hypothetical protein
MHSFQSNLFGIYSDYPKMFYTTFFAINVLELISKIMNNSPNENIAHHILWCDT